MNIKRAKQEIKDTIEAYLLKDEYGEYVIPQIRQRPVLLHRSTWYRKDPDHGADRAGSAKSGWSLIQSRIIRDRVRSACRLFQKRSLTAKSIP